MGLSERGTEGLVEPSDQGMMVWSCQTIVTDPPRFDRLAEYGVRAVAVADALCETDGLLLLRFDGALLAELTDEPLLGGGGARARVAWPDFACVLPAGGLAGV